MATYAVKLRKSHYLYASEQRPPLWTKRQRLARRFATAFEAWRWVVDHTTLSRDGRPYVRYRVVRIGRLTPRRCGCC